MTRADFFRLRTFDCNSQEVIKNRNLEEGGQVQRFIDTECLRLCQPLVPKDSNTLIQSGTIHTKIGSGQLEYRTPYARRWYYMPADFQEGSGSGMGAIGRGNYWFHRMSAQYRERILKGAQKIANGG